jgi:predicted ATP-dependent serine protease
MVKDTLAKIINGSRLDIISESMGTLSVKEIENTINAKEKENNVKYDMVIIDYADILQCSNKSRDATSYDKMKDIYTNLKALAQSKQVAIWTASQVNRAGLNSSELNMSNTADSIQIIFICDLMISISAIENKEPGKVIFYSKLNILKNRFGPAYSHLPIEMNLSNGHIQIYDPKTFDGVKIFAQIKQGNNIGKKEEHEKEECHKIMNNMPNKGEITRERLMELTDIKRSETIMKYLNILEEDVVIKRTKEKPATYSRISELEKELFNN